MHLHAAVTSLITEHMLMFHAKDWLLSLNYPPLSCKFFLNFLLLPSKNCTPEQLLNVPCSRRKKSQAEKKKTKSNLTSCWPLFGVPLQHVSHELHRFTASIRYESFQVVRYTLRPAKIHGSWKLVAFRPVILEEWDFQTQKKFSCKVSAPKHTSTHSISKDQRLCPAYSGVILRISLKIFTSNLWWEVSLAVHLTESWAQKESGNRNLAMIPVFSLLNHRFVCNVQEKIPTLWNHSLRTLFALQGSISPLCVTFYSIITAQKCLLNRK